MENNANNNSDIVNDNKENNLKKNEGMDSFPPNMAYDIRMTMKHSDEAISFQRHLRKYIFDKLYAMTYEEPMCYIDISSVEGYRKDKPLWTLLLVEDELCEMDNLTVNILINNKYEDFSNLPDIDSLASPLKFRLSVTTNYC